MDNKVPIPNGTYQPSTDRMLYSLYCVTLTGTVRVIEALDVETIKCEAKRVSDLLMAVEAKAALVICKEGTVKWRPVKAVGNPVPVARWDRQIYITDTGLQELRVAFDTQLQTGMKGWRTISLGAFLIPDTSTK